MNEKEFFKNYRRFKNDYDRLYRWYLATLLSYDLSEKEIQEILRKKGLHTDQYERVKVYYQQEKYDDLYLIQHDHLDLLKKYRKGYKVFLDEMVLIRLVTLLEVLTSDMIETCFYYDKRPFLKKGKYEINIAEFLYKNKEQLEKEYIEETIKPVQRGGLNQLQKYYLQTFGIDYRIFKVSNESDTFTYKDIQKLHDTRHLIIHRLSKTDEKYRRDYNYSKKTIQLTEPQVLYYLELVLRFTDFLKEQFKEKIIH